MYPDILTDNAAKHLLLVENQVVQIRRARLENLLPAESQQLLRYVRRLICRLLDLFDIGTERGEFASSFSRISSENPSTQ